MKKISFSLMVAVLALRACASPAAVGTTQPSSSDQVVTVVAATMQALPTNMPEPPSQEEIAFKFVKQMGGLFDAVAVEGNIIYLGIGARFVTVDINDPSSPRRLWQSEVLSDLVGAVAVQSTVAYIRAGTELLAYDVSDPARPAQVGAFGGVSGGLLATEDHVYTFAAGREPTLIATDVSDPAHPVEAGRRTVGANPALAVSGDVLYRVSGGGSQSATNAPGSLQLIDPTDLERTISEIALGNASFYRVAAEDDFAIVVENRHFESPDLLRLLDVGDPSSPKDVAALEMDIEQNINEISVMDKTLLLFSRSFPHTGCPVSLYSIDITDTASPQAPVRFEPQSCFNRIAVTEAMLAATSELGLEIYNVSDPANITLAGILTPPDGFITADLITLDQSLDYLMTTAGRIRLLRLRVLDLANPTAPGLLNGAGFDLAGPEPGGYGELEVRGDRLYGLEQGVVEVDISNPTNPRRVTTDVERFY